MAITRKTVEDLETLKAVSHPLRMALLGLLRIEGPATASELARALGESSGSTSYHLRQLERFGFVGDAPEQPSGRERRWQALHDATVLPSALADLDGGREYLDAVRRRQEQHLCDGLEAWTEPMPGIGHSDYDLRLDPDELQQMLDDVHAVIEGYAHRGGAVHVALHVLTLPQTA
ncbi:ArsR/SmtB family transcription factor [Aeromicrobium wangtongii]|uniref:Helix-turn-helix domain-containing protein n=1 Tax=Aeromicrobium wangtongii TaxID=2969247 RepID=A0ABY5M7L0_9ACTN|nr:helix-turn-helix domain-containing protein [Aeromicrobium wangtongii]MCD9199210.1 helix-turn-helix domain-containing protein [Aeromicrobium wangtongii]UUP12762.1 helix-turn-helix domain-containing protein [Aeromicrobium wangtongii]